MDDKDTAFLERINRRRIKPRDMEAALIALDRLPSQGRTFEATMGAIATLFPKRSTDYRVAMTFRLQALAYALKDLSIVPGLGKRGSKGATLVADWSIAAACACTLVEGQPAEFDLTEFKARAMEAANPEGSA